MITNHPYHINSVWKNLLQITMQYGSKVSPRGRLTKEIIAGAATIDMSFPILTVIPRKIGHKFMAAEAYWILSGSDRVEDIAPYCERYRTFSDDGYTLYGAYGPRWKSQREHVVETLQEDRHSRQAVITFWKQNPNPSKDVPCTISAQWVIRSGSLHCILNMRSSDLWLGFPYDIFTFTMLTHQVMWHLNGGASNSTTLTIGNLYYSAGSMHLYMDDLPQVVQCMTGDEVLYKPFNPVFVTLTAMLDWLHACRKGLSPLYVIHEPTVAAS